MSVEQDWQPTPPQAPANTPPGKVFLNLDTETREEIEPFGFVLNGRRVVMRDPVELDWQDLLALEDETEFVRLAMDEGDKEFFLKQRLPAWKMRRLIKNFQDHYGIDDISKAG